MSNHICNTPTCAISLSQAAFPVAMNCPVCQRPLEAIIEEASISPEEQLLLSNLPYVIAYPLQRSLSEKHAWTKINLLKDTFLNYLKYLGLITASEFFNSRLKDKKMVALFQQALAEPSFGSWNQYIRETLNYLVENNHSFFCRELVDYYSLVENGKKRKLYKGEIEYIDGNGDSQLKKQEATAIGMLINFRNRYLGHGLTLDENSSKKIWDEYYPIFKYLLEQLSFATIYPMYKQEHGETLQLQSCELISIEKGSNASARVWIENKNCEALDILPFYVVPGEVSITKEDKEKILAYESYTGKTIKFFSPEGTEKQTSGKILEKLNLLLRDKLREEPFTPEQFNKEQFVARTVNENKLLLDTLLSEKKVIPNVYVHREEMEIKLREWIGALANIFFIAAEAGSGKTNLLVEIQKQYHERGYSSIFIRAGRMDKPSLKQQLAYTLNLDEEKELSKYNAIAGTQDAPVFILIDGLNEATHAEAIWEEIISISKLFVPGGLKFIVSSRANTKADLERFIIANEDESLLYGENKDHENGVSAYCHWLTAMNMAEMKSAWENYAVKDKSRFKPNFSFDDIAIFDRAIYNQISNPLVLRIFLEIYHNKSLPQKGNKHLNIWGDWLNTFSKEEQTFLKLLTAEIWNKGENELLLDDLLNNEIFKPYLTTDVINAPYPRLKHNGWVSRYVKDLNSYVAFTVEGALLYLLGVKLQTHDPVLDLTAIEEILQHGNKLKRSAIESFLCRKALEGDLKLVCEIIDAGDKYLDICITPMLLFLKAFGPKAMLDIVLANPTENDWKALFSLDELISELELHILRKEYLMEMIALNRFQNKTQIWLGLKACSIFDKEHSDLYYLLISKKSKIINNDIELLIAIGDLENIRGNYDNALESLQKSVEIGLTLFGIKSPIIAKLYNNIGNNWHFKGNYNKAIEYYQKSLDIHISNFGIDHLSVATLFNDIGFAYFDKDELEKALVFYDKCLNIELKKLGDKHPDLATTYNNIGCVWIEKNEPEIAIDFFQKSLVIRLESLGSEHIDVATLYNNIGRVYHNKEEYDKALEFYQKCLDIELTALGDNHPTVATSYFNIGDLHFKRGMFELSLSYHNKCLEIRLKSFEQEHPLIIKSYYFIGLCLEKTISYESAINFYNKLVPLDKKGLFSFQIAKCLEKLNNNAESIIYFIKSAEVRKDDPEAGPKHRSTLNAINNAVRLAKQLGKEDELPDWMK